MKKIFSVFDRKDWMYCAISIISTMSGAVFGALSPFFYARIMNELQYVSQHYTQLEWTGNLTLNFALMLSFPFVSILFYILGILFGTRGSVSVATKLRSILYQKSLGLSAQDLDKITKSSIITRTTGDIVQIQTFLIMFFSTFVTAVSLLICGFTLSLYQVASFDGNSDIWYLAFTYLLFPVLILVIFVLVSKGLPLFKKARTAIDENNTIMQENILGNRLIRAFNMQEQQLSRYEKGNANLRTRNIRTDRILIFILPVITLIMNLSTVFVYMFSGIYSINADPNQALTTIKLVSVIQSFIGYFLQMLIGLSLIGSVAFNFTRAKTCATRAFEVIDTINPIVSGNNDSEIINGDIEFKNVNFKYDENDNKNVLTNINFKIKNGQTLGILGQTGSGKSTLVNLILRLYDIKEGEILIDDINIKDYHLDKLRKNITMAIQEKVLIKGTIKENILVGNKEASIEEMIAATKDAQAYEFISKLPDQFDSPVEQKGKNFSGGQQQRLSIARALIKKAKIIIFDDSTSALDNLTESKLLNNLKEKYNNRTKIIISQKIRTIKDANHIIVLKNGKIAEQGKHKELLKKNGLYKSIYDSQESSMEK